MLSTFEYCLIIAIVFVFLAYIYEDAPDIFYVYPIFVVTFLLKNDPF